MIPFLKKIFKFNNNNNNESEKVSKELFDTIHDITCLSNDIIQKKKDLYSKEYELLLKNKEDVFISLKDFLDLMDIDNLTIKDILVKCKHSSNIHTQATSSVVLHSIVEDDHIVLCRDIKNCDKHKDCVADKIRITSIRLVNDYD